MKSTFRIVLIIALAIAVIALVVGSKNEVEAPTVTETETAQNENTGANTMPMNDHGMTPEEHAQMMGDSTMGSDVGMEMPIMESEQTAGAVVGEKKMFMIDGSNFTFDVKELRVKEGDVVTIHFTSADGFHDLVIDEFNVRTEKLRTGGMGMVTFVADRKGTFEYYCSVGSHRASGMVGKLIVE